MFCFKTSPLEISAPIQTTDNLSVPTHTHSHTSPCTFTRVTQLMNAWTQAPMSCTPDVCHPNFNHKARSTTQMHSLTHTTDMQVSKIYSIWCGENELGWWNPSWCWTLALSGRCSTGRHEDDVFRQAGERSHLTAQLRSRDSWETNGAMMKSQRLILWKA